MSLENAINQLCINIISINTTLLKMLETQSISSDAQLSSNINISHADCGNKSSLDQVRKSLNDVVKVKGKDTAVKLLATYYNAKTLDDIQPHEYSNVIKKAKSILEAS